MARYEFTTHVDAPPEVVFDLWTNLDRMKEWVGGVTGVSDVSGPIDRVGTTYVVSFGRMKSRTLVTDAERPRVFGTKFGNRILRGRNLTTFEAENGGTRITEALETEGVVSAIMAWLFSRGSYRGSFRGELEHFGRLAEADARASGR